MRSTQKQPTGSVQDKGLRSHCSGSVHCHLAKAGTTLSPASLGASCQGHWEWAAFLELDAAVSCLLGSSYLEIQIQNHLQEEGAPRACGCLRGTGTCAVSGSRMEPEVLSSSAMMGMSCLQHFLTLTARVCKHHQHFPLKPSQPARHRPRHPPCKTPGKSAKKSIFSLPTVRCISFPPMLTACCPGAGGVCLTPAIFMATKYICIHFRPTDIIPSEDLQFFMVSTVMIFRL